MSEGKSSVTPVRFTITGGSNPNISNDYSRLREQQTKLRRSARLRSAAATTNPILDHEHSTKCPATIVTIVSEESACLPLPDSRWFITPSGNVLMTKPEPMAQNASLSFSNLSTLTQNTATWTGQNDIPTDCDTCDRDVQQHENKSTATKRRSSSSSKSEKKRKTNRHRSQLFIQSTVPRNHSKSFKRITTNGTTVDHPSSKNLVVSRPNTDAERSGTYRELEILSEIISSNSMFRPSLLSGPCADSNALSHTYLAKYGTDYYRSLIQRENKQCDDSKERLDKHASMNTAFYCPRIRTRSFSRNLTDSDAQKERKEQTNSNTTEPTENTEFTNAPRYITTKFQSRITASMRATLVDWLIEIALEFRMNHETLHCSIYLMDRALEEIQVAKDTFHSLGCACLLIASKLGEIKHPRPADIAFFTNNACSIHDICNMELEITSILQFHLQYVTAYHFVGRFINASHIVLSQSSPSELDLNQDSDSTEDSQDDDHEETSSASTSTGYNTSTGQMDVTQTQYSYLVNEKVEAMALFFLDMSLMIPELVDMKRSLVAASAVYLARAVSGVKDRCGNIWSDAMNHCTGYNVNELVNAVLLLHRYCNRNIAGVMKRRGAVFKKYMRKEFLEVAKKASILLEDLKLPVENKRRQDSLDEVFLETVPKTKHE
mmetsp:Transcript_15439/g.17948  ORF Transcript_15439/g.17948 Transcript_15439/m.17948 type:complete len:662 (-) Transcript_15439:54-2039(-)